MAQRTIIELTDDIDGKKADETVTFSLDGTVYEIDLRSKNAEKLRKGLEPFVAGARKANRAKTGRRGGRNARTANSRERSQEIREWARANGIAVNDRGRIPATVVEKYDAAH